MAVSSLSLVTFTIAANLVLLRMYVRSKRRIIGWDDYTICVALVNSILDPAAMESSVLLTGTGTVPPGNGGQCLSNCEWRRPAY